ncbi:MAG TPA: hypothetical protein VG099_10345 [Gemmataceae bacterium]|jgi:hypothetical protein|nr:hypothetical protein [Gemmataceae bacterium]
MALSMNQYLICLGYLLLAPVPGVWAQNATPKLYDGKPLRQWLRSHVEAVNEAMKTMKAPERAL